MFMDPRIQTTSQAINFMQERMRSIQAFAAGDPTAAGRIYEDLRVLMQINGED